MNTTLRIAALTCFSTMLTSFGCSQSDTPVETPAVSPPSQTQPADEDKATAGQEDDHAGHDHDGADHTGHDHGDNDDHAGHNHGDDDGHDHTGHDHAADDGHHHGDHVEVPLGSTKIGDITIECLQGHGTADAGKEMHLVVKLPYNDKGSTTIRAWVGTSDRLASMVAKGEYAPSHDDYDMHAMSPDPLPAGAKWWIEITKPDGTSAVGSIDMK